MQKTIILIFAVFSFWGCLKSKHSRQEEGTLALMDISANDVAVVEEAMELEYTSLDMASSLSNGNSYANKTFSNENNQSAINKKIIRTGSIEIQSENVQKSRNELETVLNETKSYIQNEEFFNYSYREGFRITIRVPNQNFDSLTNSLSNKGIGIIRSKNISSSDVTEDYYDTEIRLKNKEIYLEKYRDFLTKAKTVEDMLEVQEKIRNLEEEIESAKGKLRFIDDKVNFSTLNINIYREKPDVSIASELGFWGNIWKSILIGWNTLTVTFFWFLSMWSVWLILGVIVWGIVKIRKNRKSRKYKIKN